MREKLLYWFRNLALVDETKYCDVLIREDAVSPLLALLSEVSNLPWSHHIIIILELTFFISGLNLKLRFCNMGAHRKPHNKNVQWKQFAF